MALGATLASLRHIPMRIWGLIRSRLRVTLEVTSDSPSYYWLSLWLSQHPYTRRARNVMVLTDRSAPDTRTAARRLVMRGTAEPDDEIPYTMALGQGEHLLWWRGRPVWISSLREKNESGASSRAYMFTLTLMSYGMTRETLNGLVEEAHRSYVHQMSREAGIWLSRWEDEWSEEPNLSLRPLSTLVFEPSTIDAVLGDAQRFFDRRERYEELGIPVRRGYLLHGPPGTGKTSLAIGVAHELQRELCMLPLSRPHMDDQTLVSLMTRLPEHAMVLIEDVDTIFEGRENKSENQVTFSGFLNALDGALAQTGQLVVMTTNRPDVLDPALVRPGRIDVQVEIGAATQYQARELFLRFFPGRNNLAEVFALSTPPGTSMAQLQEFLVRYMNDAETAAYGPVVAEEVP